MKKKLPIIIVLIAIVITAIGVVLLINTKPKEEKQTKKEVKKEETAIDTEKYNEVQEQVQNEISIFDMYMSNLYPIEDIDKIKDEDKTKLLVKVLSKEDIESVEEDKVLEESKKHFDNYNLYKKSTDSYKYENNKYSVVKNNYETCSIKTITTKEINNQEEWITTKKVYYVKLDLKDPNKLTYEVKVYKNYKDCSNNKNELLTKDNTITTISEEDYNSIEKDLKTLTYTLKNTDGTYKITSIK